MKLNILIVGLIALIFMVVPAMAVSCSLDIVQKDASWNVIGGSSGTLTYEASNFVFNGAGLQNSVDYTLINYGEPYPGTGDIVLGHAVSTGGGVISITGTMPTTLTSTTDAEGKAKIWLVLTSDLTGTVFNTWQPNLYLFEKNLIPINPAVCEPTLSDGIDVTGNIVQVLSIESSADIEFNDFDEKTNILTNAGTITIISAFIPNWTVLAATSDGEGYMRNGIGAPVSGTPLKNKLMQYNYKSSAWEPANGLTFGGSSDYTMPESFSQLVLINDKPGTYSTVVTYTITAT